MGDIAANEILKNAPVIGFVHAINDPWIITEVLNNAPYPKISGIDNFPFNLLTIIHPDDHDNITRIVDASLLQKKEQVTIRYRIQTGDYFRWAEEVIFFEYDNQKNPVSIQGCLWISTIVAECHMLNKSAEAWNLLNSKIRHDMLNQLTAIVGYLELSHDIITDPTIIDYVEKEQKAADRLQQKLIFTREYQKIGLTEFGWFNLKNLILEALQDGIPKSFNCEFNGNFGKIFVDKSFKLALTKIIENVQTCAKGATILKFNFKSTPEGGLLSIEDNGVGIPLKFKERIFDIGFGEGPGYGLFLSQYLLTIFGVVIKETGTEGSSARFELFIPNEILDS